MTPFYCPLAFFVVGRAAYVPETRLLGFIVFVTGLAIWTLVEYLVHRFVLHPPFPDGKGILRHALHRLFDNLHWEHHERPWDGNNLAGSLSQTLPFFAPMGLASLLSPLAIGPALLSGLVLG
jgi:hypothetical protein